MSSDVTIRRVSTKADLKALIEFPWKLYKDDPVWVPPLLSMRRELFDKTKHPAWEYLTGEFFTAWRGGEIVGTIAAYINHRHNQFHNEQIGWFGAFETINDQAVSDALLTTASDWVRAQGYHALRGPQTFSPHDECGLLIDGFTRPVLLMPYNPPYYQALVEQAGFHKAKDVYSFFGNSQETVDTGIGNRLQRMV
ncbi:MAG: N-acetyltransferase, partial [Chloroflexi bacterium]|nr:N-acetyltransferase [Chloroflexota bacterium]